MELIRWVQGKLVDDWRAGKRWWSAWGSIGGIGFNVLAGAVLKGITIVIPLVGFVPAIWLPVIGCVIAALTLIARFVKQPEKQPKEDETDSAGC